MPSLSFERHVPHRPEDMLSLIADVESYPDFVPNCDAMRVRRDPARPETCDARMRIRFGPIAQAYTSRVTRDEAAGTVAAHALDGPFSHLRSLWRITPEGEGSKVTFEIDFGFSNRLIAAAAERAFAAKQTEIMDAFMAEAKRRFGR